ncbi:MAG TPA: GNAT family N-acetyltransferase [Ktedonobacterales bacterium]
MSDLLSGASHAPGASGARFQFRPMRLEDAREAGRWRYPSEYAIYDLDPLALTLTALLRAPLRAFGFHALAVGMPGDPMISVFSFIKRGVDVEIGVGMRPDLMGRGLGLGLMLSGMDYARARLHPATFSLTVATFNRRAITVYERAGFVPGAITRVRLNGQFYDSMAMSRAA